MDESGVDGPSRAGTVVLVPGGFLEPWIWQEVERELQAAGLATLAVALESVAGADDSVPGGLGDDVSAVRAALDNAEPPVVLCGHSYGGLVITEAAAGPHPSIARLVYLAGAAPDAGQSLADLGPAEDTDDAAESTGDASEAEQVRARSDGTIELSAASAIAGLFNDCDTEKASRAAAKLRPMNPAVNQEPVTAAPWRSLPTTYVRCTEDRVPELVATGFLDCVGDVVELPTGHCPQWSRPDLVARLLLERAAMSR